MNKSNAENIRIKRDYFAHLKGPGRQSEASLDAVAKALSRFEATRATRTSRPFAGIRQSASRFTFLAKSTNGRASR